MVILRDIIIYLLAFGSYWLISYFSKSGSNTADKKDKRGISYEGKKGANIADEEDQISLAQKERLIRILYIAEQINQAQNKYLLYFYDITSRAKFDKLVEDLNSLLTELYHQQRLANLYLPKEQQNILDELLTNVGGVVMELSTNLTNAATFITSFNYFMNYANTNKQEQSEYWKHARKCKDNLDGVRNKKILFKDDCQKSIQKYADWLGEYLKQSIRVMS